MKKDHLSLGRSQDIRHAKGMALVERVKAEQLEAMKQEQNTRKVCVSV